MLTLAKRISVLFFVVCVTLCGCGQTLNHAELYLDYRVFEPDIEEYAGDIILSAEVSEDKNTVTVTLMNNSKQTLYGQSFWLNVWRDGEWQRRNWYVSAEHDEDNKERILPPGEVWSEELSADEEVYRITFDNYRAYCTFYTDEARTIENRYCVSYEFEVK